jgi:enoyl-CoA hydratase
MTNSAQACIHVSVDGAGVAWLTLDNPSKLNAISLPMWHTLSEALARFENDPAVRCVVVSGQGDKAFCVGADISQFEKVRSGPEANAEYERITRGALRQLQSFSKPTIAMIRGFCLGGGAALAIMCDLRMAAASSRFGIPAARLGIGYFYAGVKRLTDLVGPSQAKRMLFAAERYGADEMLRIGLIDELLPDAELDKRVQALTALIAANAPLSVASAKFTVETLLSEPGERDIAACQAREKACIESEDHAEGRRAFMEKRTPVFRGR